MSWRWKVVLPALQLPLAILCWLGGPIQYHIRHHVWEGRASMRRRLIPICIMTMFLIGFTSPSVRAQDPDGLKGINAVYVIVEDVPEAAKKLGLTTESIQTDVELKLLLAGMSVTTLADGHKLPGRPHVYVRVTLTKGAEVASIQVDLEQDAVLDRNAEHALSVMTWDTDYLLANPTAQRILDDVKDGVDQFMSAWLSVNPKT